MPKENRFLVFREPERNLIYDGLVELYNNIPARHRRKLKLLEELMNELEPEDADE